MHQKDHCGHSHAVDRSTCFSQFPCCPPVLGFMTYSLHSIWPKSVPPKPGPADSHTVIKFSLLSKECCAARHRLSCLYRDAAHGSFCSSYRSGQPPHAPCRHMACTARMHLTPHCHPCACPKHPDTASIADRQLDYLFACQVVLAKCLHIPLSRVP